MVGWSLQVFTRYCENDITCIRSHLHREESKLRKNIIGYDANSWYLYCLGKDTLVVNEKQFNQKWIKKFSKHVLRGKVFGFVQVDIDVHEELYDKLSEITMHFVVYDIPNRNATEEIKMYKEKMVKNNQRN